jgi:Uma2 family endonuclease
LLDALAPRCLEASWLSEGEGSEITAGQDRMSDMATLHERHRVSLDEYHRMVEAGVFEEATRVELINGELIEMAPIYPPHASAVDRIMQHFAVRFAGRAWVRCQNPVTLPCDSEPQPDLVLARIGAGDYRDRHPEPADILLAVEVADSSLLLDHRVKIPLYAQSRIPEVWLVNLVDGEIIAHREPEHGSYRNIKPYRRGESLAPAAISDDAFAVADLLPDPV